MMEVKSNSAVEIEEHKSSDKTTTNGVTELESDLLASEKDLLRENDFSDDIGLREQISPELEDVLLEGVKEIPNAVTAKGDIVSGIFAEGCDNKTNTGSNTPFEKTHNPGDDLNKLMSKIDCISDDSKKTPETLKVVTENAQNNCISVDLSAEDDETSIATKTKFVDDDTISVIENPSKKLHKGEKSNQAILNDANKECDKKRTNTNKSSSILETKYENPLTPITDLQQGIKNSDKKSKTENSIDNETEIIEENYLEMSTNVIQENTNSLKTPQDATDNDNCTETSGTIFTENAISKDSVLKISDKCSGTASELNENQEKVEPSDIENKKNEEKETIGIRKDKVVEEVSTLELEGDVEKVFPSTLKHNFGDEKTIADEKPSPDLNVEDSDNDVEGTEKMNDNSGNARDDFVEEKKVEDSSGIKHQLSEKDKTNNNCSSNSNLLQKSKCSTIAKDHSEDPDNENDGDIELVENSALVEQNDNNTEDHKSVPPAKRIRFSQVSDESCQIMVDEDKISKTNSFENKTENSISNSKIDTSKITSDTNEQLVVKRTHDCVETKANKDETLNVNDQLDLKKLRTDTDSGVEKKDIVSQESFKNANIAVSDCDEKYIKVIDTDSKLSTDIKQLFKGEPSQIPIPLYPPPKYDVESPNVKLEFLKKFRKPLSKMTKVDLEELVAVKLVESLIFTSELAQLRELANNQEKLLTGYRSKITELTKQFRDLEMVHNRTKKDLEAKNSEVILPCKITRSVGLQVSIPKKNATVLQQASVPITANRSLRSATATTTPMRQSPTVDNSPTRSIAVMSTARLTPNTNSRRGRVQKTKSTKSSAGRNRNQSSK